MLGMLVQGEHSLGQSSKDKIMGQRLLSRKKKCCKSGRCDLE